MFGFRMKCIKIKLIEKTTRNEDPILFIYLFLLAMDERPGCDVKGQLISKADWGAIDSPKKRTDEFVLFAFLLFTANKSNSFVRFFGESAAPKSAFEIN